MPPEKGQIFRVFKLPPFGICLRRGCSQKMPYHWTECVDGRKWCHWICEGWDYRCSEIHFHLWFLQSIITLQKKTQKCLWCSRPQSLMVLRCVHAIRSQQNVETIWDDFTWNEGTIAYIPPHSVSQVCCLSAAVSSAQWAIPLTYSDYWFFCDVSIPLHASYYN